MSQTKGKTKIKTKKTRRINVRLLHRIQQHILEEPKRLDMGTFIERIAIERIAAEEEDYPEDYAKKFPTCGTIGCIAGWAVTLSSKEGREVPYADIPAKAKRLLGLTPIQADRLFYASSWPNPLAYKIDNSNPQTKAHAKLTAKRIDRFIASKGEE